MNEIGRPTKYKDEYARMAERHCRLGATDNDLALLFDVDPSTIRRWSLSHEEFCLSKKIGKDTADTRVEQSLYQRAIGYDVVEVKRTTKNSDTVDVVTTTKHMPSDVVACIFWLKNRKPSEWRDRNQPVPFDEADAEPLTINFTVNEPKGEIQITNARPARLEEQGVE